MNLKDLQVIVAGASGLRIVGCGTQKEFLPVWVGEEVLVSNLCGIIAVETSDLVFEAWAGTSLQEVQEELGRHGLHLPLSADLDLPPLVRGGGGTLGGLVAMNLPHALSSQCGGPKEWTIGMTVVRSDGTVAKCGSKVVKNVAGFDVHRLFVGSRGTLGAIAKVTMRAYPKNHTKTHEVETIDATIPAQYVARTLTSDFEKCAKETSGVVAVDRASSTLWSNAQPQHFGEGWVIGPAGFRAGGNVVGELEEAAKAIFDPMKKFAPGWHR